MRRIQPRLWFRQRPPAGGCSAASTNRRSLSGSCLVAGIACGVLVSCGPTLTDQASTLPSWSAGPDVIGPWDHRVPVNNIVVFEDTRMCVFGYLSRPLSKILGVSDDDPRFETSVDFGRALEEHGQSRLDADKAARSINVESVSGYRGTIAAKYCTNNGHNILVTILSDVKDGLVRIEITARQGADVASFSFAPSYTASPPVFTDDQGSSSSRRASYQQQVSSLSSAAGKKLLDQLNWRS